MLHVFFYKPTIYPEQNSVLLGLLKNWIKIVVLKTFHDKSQNIFLKCTTQEKNQIRLNIKVELRLLIQNQKKSQILFLLNELIRQLNCLLVIRKTFEGGEEDKIPTYIWSFHKRKVLQTKVMTPLEPTILNQWVFIGFIYKIKNNFKATASKNCPPQHWCKLMKYVCVSITYMYSVYTYMYMYMHICVHI